VALAAVIEKAIEIVRPAADAKSIRLQAVLDTEAGFVLADAERLQQVVWNLLSNAIKFTPKDGRVHVGLERVDSHVEIGVSDTGEGIEPAFMPFLFDRFEQHDASTTRTHTGLGLGLAIVRHIVEAHGGTVHAKSDGRGRGALFTVALPLMVARGAEQPDRRHPTANVDEARAARHSSPRLDGLRLLVVDDEPESSEVIAMILSDAGADVHVAGSAAGARDVLSKSKIDLLVSDIGMPEEDGYHLISSVRRREDAIGNIPAVALTAYASREDKIKMLSAGFQLHIPKPVDSAELIAAIATLARSIAARRA
jgi:CheY-like chemotaxis protein